MAYIAKGAATCADVAHDHERRRALGEALADVRARRFLAHRVQLVLAQVLKRTQHGLLVNFFKTQLKEIV